MVYENFPLVHKTMLGCGGHIECQISHKDGREPSTDHSYNIKSILAKLCLTRTFQIVSLPEHKTDYWLWLPSFYFNRKTIQNLSRGPSRQHPCENEFLFYKAEDVRHKVNRKAIFEQVSQKVVSSKLIINV